MSGGKNIAIVGAGISGLSCGYELYKAGFDVTVFEKENYVGGRMASRKKDGLYFDIGADHLCNLYDHMKEYCEELDIPWKKVSFLEYEVFKRGKNVPLEKVVGFISALRFALEYKKKHNVHDFFDLAEAAKYDSENAYDYMKRHAGNAVANYLVDGFTSTYQFHGAHEISVGALFGILESIKNNEAKWYLHHMNGGMSALPEAIASKIKVNKGVAVENVIAPDENGGKVKIESANGKENFDIVVLASTANCSLSILKNPTQDQRELLENTKYATTISVSYKVQKSKLPDVAIVWVPKVESKSVSGYVNESMKGEELLKDGKTLLNTWMHEDFAKTIIDKSDEEIFQIVKRELLKVCPWFDDENEFENFDLQRWPAAMPKFSQEHLTRVAKFLDDGHQGENNIFICGDFMNSPWIEGSIRCGKRTAKQILAKLQ